MITPLVKYKKCQSSIVAILALFVISIPGISFGAENSLTGTEAYFRVIWGLLVVLGIILVLYGLLRKRFSLLHTNSNRNIQIIEYRPIQGKKGLCLVKVRGKELLLGLSGDSINHLADLTTENEKTKPSFDDVLHDRGD